MFNRLKNSSSKKFREDEVGDHRGSFAATLNQAALSMFRSSGAGINQKNHRNRWNRATSIALGAEMIQYSATSSHRERNTCVHCSSKLGFSRHKSCGICGHGFCGKCTGYYILPEKFLKNTQKNISRVCFTCRNECYRLQFRYVFGEDSSWNEAILDGLDQEKKTFIEGLPRRKLMVRSFDSDTVYVHPCGWRVDKHYECCFLCDGKFKRKNYNCRLCGELFCIECTTKVTGIPFQFDKKGKIGAYRVCNECRYHLYQGAQPNVEVPQPEKLIQSDFWLDNDPDFENRRNNRFASRRIQWLVENDDDEDNAEEENSAFNASIELQKPIIPHSPTPDHHVQRISEQNSSKDLLSLKLVNVDDADSIPSNILVEKNLDLLHLVKKAKEVGAIPKSEVYFIYKDILIPNACWSAVDVRRMGPDLFYRTKVS